MGKKKRYIAFTLVELMVVVVIGVIIAAIAVPNYIESTERSRGREARAVLHAIIAGQQMYAAERNQYIGLGAATNDAWNAVGVDNPNLNKNRAFDYVFNAVTMEGTATRKAVGPQSGNTIIMKLDGSEAGTYTW